MQRETLSSILCSCELKYLIKYQTIIFLQLLRQYDTEFKSKIAGDRLPGLNLY